MNIYNNFDPVGSLLSEKHDGIAAEWTTERLESRDGNVFHAPAWFLDSLPRFPFKGELWAGRGRFEEALSIVTSRNAGERWRDIQFVAWQCEQPHNMGPFARHVERYECQSVEHLHDTYERLIAEGAEGLVIRDRSGIDWKMKPRDDDDATVIGHAPGTGRNAGRLGALLVEDRAGRRFRIGMGLGDTDRDNPLPLGTVITFEFQGRTARGIPKSATYRQPRAETSLMFQ